MGGNAETATSHMAAKQQINRLASDSYKASLIVVWVLAGHTQPGLMSLPTVTHVAGAGDKL